MTDTESRRRAFEAEYLAKFKLKPHHWNPEMGKYVSAHEQGAWWAWQAALDSVVVELPRRAETGGEGIDLCREAIHAAGVRTNE